MQKQFSRIPETEPVIELTHIYDAPRALMWELFTKPEHLKHWWGPDGFTIEHESADFRVGGYWKFVMVGPDGTRWDNYHQYTEIDPIERFVHLHGSKRDDPDAFVATITLEDRGSQTAVTLTQTFPNLQARADVMAFGAHVLGLQTLAKAETYLQNTELEGIPS
ncbi:MAG: SRPBCC domain-containing protein [Hyphomicrobiaceae bacterium]|nr:SRPBCC domain-containing protein [Hyphomicrobiaceae bacterium]